jgi:hypothetical protein
MSSLEQDLEACRVWAVEEGIGKCKYGLTCSSEKPCVYCERDALKSLVRELVFYLDNYNDCLPNADVRGILSRLEVKKIMKEGK